ncbi:MAG: hypothetical protein Q9165_007727 [Trypethelium subeluteriae]
MPRVISYTPPWLTRPSRGSDFFNASPTAKTSTSGQEKPYRGPRRTTVRCGRNLFTVVGNELRWANLSQLKDDWAEKSRTRWTHSSRQNADNQSLVALEHGQETGGPLYKVGSSALQQLVVSPKEEYLAIVTSHTIHITIIPDSAHIVAPDISLKPKTFQLGPTAHVLDRSPIASVLWHPLGVKGNCLVTVTKDATVRLWELSRENRYSFDEPALAVDLKKLANATSYEEDFKASRPGASRGFSPDEVEMEVAAACFGGSGLSDEHGWSSMTLWVAMTEGDLYALCPLLPSKWQPSSTQIPSLSTAVVAKTAATNTNPASTTDERRKADQQFRWFQDIDDQEPVLLDEGLSGAQEIYSRPESLSPIPKLQGPFLLDPETDMFGDVTDIYAVAPKVDDDEMMFEEDYENFGDNEGLSVAVICLLTSSGYIHVCLDLDGVEAEWLPLKSVSLNSAFTKRLPDIDESLPTLLLVEKIHVCRGLESNENSFPTFTPDANSRYATFITHDSGIGYVSFASWTSRLEEELNSASESGSTFRLDILLEGLQSLVEHPLQIPSDRPHSPIASALSFKDPDIGYFLLTTASHQAHAAILDLPDSALPATSSIDSAPPFYPDISTSSITPHLSSSLGGGVGSSGAPPPHYETRAPYQPPRAFDTPSALLSFLKTEVPQRERHLLSEEIRLSARSLGLMQAAHRILSQETDGLGAAAAELFTRVERLVRELREQIARVVVVRERVEGVVGGEVGGAGKGGGGGGRKEGVERVEERLGRVRGRQEELGERYQVLRRKLAGMGGRDLSVKEVAWKSEVEGVDERLTPLREEGNDGEGEDEDVETGLMDRFEEVKRLAKELVAQGREAVGGNDTHEDRPTSEDRGEETSERNGVGVAPAFRKAKVTEVEQMLERESALVEATMEKLDRLKLQPL